MTDAKIGFWDTEFTPNTGYFWGLWDQNIPPSFVKETQRMLCYGFKEYKKPTVVVDERVGRREMLESLRDRITSVDLIVSWNGMKYDTRMANREFIKEGLTPPAPPKEIDLMRVAKSRFAFASNKLDFVAQELGVGRKVDTGGFALWEGVMAGDEASWRKMRKYQKGDVDLLEKLFEVLKPWIRMPHPVRDLGGLVCRNCGDTHLQSRGVQRTLQGEYPRYQCVECGTWMRGPQRTPVGDTRTV
ncbi:DnaQ-like DNA polymerase III subunit [Microbacterium phage Lifes]|nr:DnaQ-like DNA polymerase III subunit [Microbacterium phage Lifes]